jgi:hypothetical protein
VPAATAAVAISANAETAAALFNTAFIACSFYRCPPDGKMNAAIAVLR